MQWQIPAIRLLPSDERFHQASEARPLSNLPLLSSRLPVASFG